MTKLNEVRATAFGMVLSTVALLMNGVGLVAQEALPERTVIEAALTLIHSDIKDLWPGYSVPREFLLCPTGGGLLLALEGRPRSLPVIELQSRTASGIALFYASERPGGLTRCIRPLGFDFDGRRLLAFPQIDSMYSLHDPRLAPAAVLVHEGFHMFQFRHFTMRDGETGPAVLEEPPAVPLEIVTAEPFPNLAARERALLNAALGLSDVVRVRSVLSEYVCVRRERMALIPERFREGEAHNERKEGSAHYVGIMWASAESDGSLSGAGIVASDLQGTPDFRENPSALRHWHIYAVGAALGLLFDRLGIAWKEEVTAGATFQDVLGEVVEPDCRSDRLASPQGGSL